MPVHVRVENSEFPRLRLEGEGEHVRPVLGETVAVSVTVPVNPSTGDTVIVDVGFVLTLAVMLAGPVDTVKSVMA